MTCVCPGCGLEAGVQWGPGCCPQPLTLGQPEGRGSGYEDGDSVGGAPPALGILTFKEQSRSPLMGTDL